MKEKIKNDSPHLSIRLSAPERMILESIGRNKVTIGEIAEDLNQPYGTVHELVRGLVELNLLRKKPDSTLSLIPDKLSTVDVKGELTDLVESAFKSCLANKHQSIVGLQKIWMSDRDEKIFKALLQNVETFVLNLKKDNATNENRLFQQKIIFWGVSEYNQITDEVLGL